MTATHQSSRSAAHPAPDTVLVQHSGRFLRPWWSLYPGGRRLRLSLREMRGSAPPLAATVDIDWICEEDQVVLRDRELHRALAQAGVVREDYAALRSSQGTLILARLTAAELERLPEQVCEAGLSH